MVIVESANSLWLEKFKTIDDHNKTVMTLTDPTKRLLSIPFVKLDLNRILNAVAHFFNNHDISQIAKELKENNNIMVIDKKSRVKSRVLEFELIVINDKVVGSFRNKLHEEIERDLPYRIFVNTMIQEYVANELDLEVGNYYHESIAYLEDKAHFRMLLGEDSKEAIQALEYSFRYVTSNKLNKVTQQDDLKLLGMLQSTLNQRDEHEFVESEDLRNRLAARVIKQISPGIINDLVFANLKIKNLLSLPELYKENNYEQLFDHNNLMDWIIINSMTNKPIKYASLVIIEGSDGAGKTTFIKNNVDDNAIKVDFPSPKNFNKYIYFYVAFIHGNIVLDRFLLSDVVYADLFKREPITTKQDNFYISEMLDLRKALTIYVDADPIICYSRLDSEDQKVFSLDMIETICKSFDEITDKPKSNKARRFNTATVRLSKLINETENKI